MEKFGGKMLYRESIPLFYHAAAKGTMGIQGRNVYMIKTVLEKLLKGIYKGGIKNREEK